MRSKQTLLVALVVAFTVCGAMSQAQASPNDQKAIRNIIARFEISWSRCDAKGLAQLWTPNGDFINPYGFSAQGRPNIEKFYAGAFSAGYCGSKGTGAVKAVRFVERDVAIVDGTWAIRGAHDSRGHPVAVESGQFTAVAVKRSGKWWIVAQREMIPAIPPRN